MGVDSGCVRIEVGFDCWYSVTLQVCYNGFEVPMSGQSKGGAMFTKILTVPRDSRDRDGG